MWANALTALRMTLSPVVAMCLMRQQPFGNLGAFWLFAFSTATDALDGYVARRLGTATRTGAFLDSFADKVLFLIVGAALIAQGLVSGVLIVPVVCIVVRDVWILFMRRARTVSTAPAPWLVLPLARLKTGMQALALACLIMTEDTVGLAYPFVRAVGEIGLWTACILSLRTFFIYLKII